MTLLDDLRSAVHVNRRFVIAGRKPDEDIKYKVRVIALHVDLLAAAADEIERLTEDNARLVAERDLWERTYWGGR